MKHDELVKRLRSGCDSNTAFLLCYKAADALVALQTELADARALLQKLRGAARLYRGGGVAGQQMGNESYSILVTGHTLGDIDAALASKPNE